MGRPLRFIPSGGGLAEVTNRTIGARHLLRPSDELNEIVSGIWARAQQLYPVAVIALAVMSNHYHALVWAADAEVLSDFMRYINSNMARELGRLHGWRSKLWARRYRAIVVSDEEAAQVERLKYILAQGTKEGLVARPRDWPGIQCAEALASGIKLPGKWVNRTTGRTEEMELAFSKLPCWEHLSDEVYRSLVMELCEEIEEEAAAYRQENGIVLRARRRARRDLLGLDPHSAPKDSKSTPAPQFHAASRETRQAMRDSYRRFVLVYREAAERLRAGRSPVHFPAGCFPPGLPFQSTAAPLRL